MHQVGRPTRLLGAGAVALAALVAGLIVPVPARAASSRPNILFVLTDDMDAASLAAMPEVRALVGDRGAVFDRYFVSNSLCCPSRVTTLRGQYAHNTGVRSNGGNNGGFREAYRRGLETDTIATRLQDAGYRTGLFGKYLNEYPVPAGPRYIPPGWNDWASPVAGDPYGEYDYTVNHNGRFVERGSEPDDYGTDYYVRLTTRFVERSLAKGAPFFAYLSVYAPHDPATPAPADVDRFAGATAPRTPSYNQADVSAMPVLIHNLPRFTPDEMSAIDRLYQRRIESLQAVDRGVADLIGTLRAARALKNTYVVFTSDNGFHLGQHRLPAGKETPYDTDVHVPFLMRGPGIAHGVHVSGMTGNVDLAPTFAAMGGAARSRSWDGRSMLALAEERGGASRHGREVSLVEHWALTKGTEPAVQVPPGTILEPPDPDQADPDAADPRLNPTAIVRPNNKSGQSLLSDRTLYGRLVKIPDYAGVRTSQWLYVEYANGDRELYDTTVDPDQMHNLAGTRPDVEAQLSTAVAALRACRAASCRIADSFDPTGSTGPVADRVRAGR